jgi:hypothetical protein
MKRCTKCGITKKYSDFHKFTKSPDGYKYQCKPCVREYDLKEHDPKRVFDRKTQGTKIQCRWCKEYLNKKEFGKSKTYCKQCSNKVGHMQNLKRYGLTAEQYIDMSNAQNNVCKICGNEEKQNRRLSVDHDHSCCAGSNSCGKCIRGLLCAYCNKTLGMVKDDIQTLQKMIDYLRQH